MLLSKRFMRPRNATLLIRVGVHSRKNASPLEFCTGQLMESIGLAFPTAFPNLTTILRLSIGETCSWRNRTMKISPLHTTERMQMASQGSLSLTASGRK